MPDWRNANDYLFLKGLPGYRLAWEFLRRNPEYRKDWEAALLRFVSRTGEFEEADPVAVLESGKALKVVSEEWSEDPDSPDFCLPVDEANRWRLASGLLNPSTDDPKWLAFSLAFGTIHFLRKGRTFKSSGPAYPIVEFNLNLPLEPQFQAISAPLKRARRHLGIKAHRIKQHRKLWPHYIRLLDAYLDDRKPKQIADVLNQESPSGGVDDKKIWDQIQAARRMMAPDEGYLTIFLSSSDYSPP